MNDRRICSSALAFRYTRLPNLIVVLFLFAHCNCAFGYESTYCVAFKIQHTQPLDWQYAEYSSFSIRSESSFYTLFVGGYSGDAGDALATLFDQYTSNGARFSTFDADQDYLDNGNCASYRHGGWWYNCCSRSVLNSQSEASWSTVQHFSSDLSDVQWSRMKIKRMS